MEIFVLWLGLSLAVGLWASNRGRSAGGWFVLSAVVSPLLGFVFLAASRNLSNGSGNGAVGKGSMRVCPECAEQIRIAAKRCRFCGAEVPDDRPHQAKIALKEAKKRHGIVRGVFIVLGGLILLPVAMAAAMYLMGEFDDPAVAATDELAPKTQSHSNPTIEQSNDDGSFEVRYVAASSLTVRDGPTGSAKAVAALKRGQSVRVYETKNGWARISPYGTSGQLDVAEWVSAKYLATKQP